ncbi:MAG: nickel pincer cofactor biosynthesis protein LarC [Agathobacter sp.]
MRTLYLDCGMGAAGDMLSAALLELLPDADAFVEKLNQVGIPKVCFSIEKSEKCGIIGTHMKVTVDGAEEDEHIHEYADSHQKHGEHFHAGMEEIRSTIDGLNLSDKVKEQIISVYEKIAKAESAVHGVSVSEVHFHEVGKLDAIADVTAVCMLLEELGPKQVIVSPVHVGSGSVKCAHGILPVPAPATAYLLTGCPIYGGKIDGELCTPTGAALLTFFATGFGEMPVMTVEKIGYGMGKKDFEKANCLRAMLGETWKEHEKRAISSEDTIVELKCNLDDMTAEELGFAMERLFAARALEVFTVPCNMKKDRPGQVLHVICEPEDEEHLVEEIFRHTTTLGIRRTMVERYRLERRMETIHTGYGDIRKKTAEGYGVSRYKYEYEDLAEIARKENLPLDAVRRIADEGGEV